MGSTIGRGRLPHFWMAVLLIVLGTPAQAQLVSRSEGRCLTPQEADALNLSLLRYRLMVAALSCDKADAYDRFVRQHRQSLLAALTVIEDHFLRYYGERAAQRRHEFSTAAVAHYNRAAISAGPNHCPGTIGTWELVLGASNAAAISEVAAEVSAPDLSLLPPRC